MAKKRSCRRTADEDRIHDMAVRIRKMTDEQIVTYVDQLVNDARIDAGNRGYDNGYTAGFEAGKKAASNEPGETSTEKFLEYLQSHRPPRCGDVTLFYLMRAAKENGYIQG